jgi:hypothetical protein
VVIRFPSSSVMRERCCMMPSLAWPAGSRGASCWPVFELTFT